VILFVVMGLSALAAGTCGATREVRTSDALYSWAADAVPANARPRLAFAAYAHQASYGVGFLGGFTLCVATAAIRYRTHRRARRSGDPTAD
ncbi:MAG: hypothetical protein AAGJ97_15840, partial [Planctomycetota bacterium]